MLRSQEIGVSSVSSLASPGLKRPRTHEVVDEEVSVEALKCLKSRQDEAWIRQRLGRGESIHDPTLESAQALLNDSVFKDM